MTTTGDDAPRGRWRVYGHDTFAGETYLVGRYDSEADARAAADDLRARIARDQDPDLRDRVWVEGPAGDDP